MAIDILKEAGMNDPCVSKENVETKLLTRGDSRRSQQKYLPCAVIRYLRYCPQCDCVITWQSQTYHIPCHYL